MTERRVWSQEQIEIFIFMVTATVFAMLMRFTLFPFESWDYHQFLKGWYAMLKANGGFAAVGLDIGNYTPAYLYFLAFFTYFPISDLAAIKLISCAADLVLAVYVMKIVRLKYQEPFYGAIAYAAVLFLPGIFLNSAVWGQCDAIYTAALAAFVYYLMRGKETPAVIAFSVSFAFKLQAIFLAPLLLLMVLKRRVRLGTLLFIPFVYLISVFPALLAGKSLWSLMTVYTAQSKLYSQLVMSLPNLYTWIPSSEGQPAYLGTAGVLFAGGVVLMVLFWLYRRNFTVKPSSLAALALLFTLLLPFVLPHMHERYFYPAEVFALIFSFYFPKKFCVGVITELICTYAESNYLFGTNFIGMQLLAVLVLGVLIAVGLQTAQSTRASSLKRAGAAE